MFPPDKIKNRRLTPKELEDDLEIARWLKRPPKTYLLDTPFYPWLPPTPKVPRVNFDLNYP